MRRAVLLCAFSALGLCGPAAAAAQQPPARPTCDGADHRRFDFWIGDWEVRDTAGAIVGHNRITRILDGCVLLEEWTSASGNEGKSFNLYDRNTGKWHQTWVDDAGSRLVLSGSFRAADLVLTGETAGANGKVLHRLSFQPRGDDVRQLWEQSRDGGTSWTVAFDGLYARTSR